MYTGPRAETSCTPSTKEQFPIALGDWVLACVRLHKRCAPHGRAVVRDYSNRFRLLVDECQALEMEATHVRVLAGLSHGKNHDSTETLLSIAEQSPHTVKNNTGTPVTPLKRRADTEPTTPPPRYRTRRVAKAEGISYSPSDATWTNLSDADDD